MSNTNRAVKRPLEANERNESSQVAKKQRKPMKPRSFVWEFFKKIQNPDVVQCNLCDKTVSYVGRNTNGMSSHLRTNHEISEQWVNDRKAEEQAARRGLNDETSEEEEETEENEISSQEINRLVQGMYIFMFLVIRLNLINLFCGLILSLVLLIR
jgi:hypothetical protein